MTAWLYNEIKKRVERDPNFPFDPKEARFLEIIDRTERQNPNLISFRIYPLQVRPGLGGGDWSFHVVLEYRKWIYDYFFDGEPRVQQARPYFNAMFMGHPDLPAEALLDQILVQGYQGTPSRVPRMTLREHLNWLDSIYD